MGWAEFLAEIVPRIRSAPIALRLGRPVRAAGAIRTHTKVLGDALALSPDGAGAGGPSTLASTRSSLRTGPATARVTPGAPPETGTATSLVVGIRDGDRTCAPPLAVAPAAPRQAVDAQAGAGPGVRSAGPASLDATAAPARRGKGKVARATKDGTPSPSIKATFVFAPFPASPIARASTPFGEARLS